MFCARFRRKLANKSNEVAATTVDSQVHSAVADCGTPESVQSLHVLPELHDNPLYSVMHHTDKPRICPKLHDNLMYEAAGNTKESQVLTIPHDNLMYKPVTTGSNSYSKEKLAEDDLYVELDVLDDDNYDYIQNTFGVSASNTLRRHNDDLKEITSDGGLYKPKNSYLELCNISNTEDHDAIKMSGSDEEIFEKPKDIAYDNYDFEKQVKNSQLSSDMVLLDNHLVLIRGTMRGCDRDPNRVVSLYPDKDDIYLGPVNTHSDCRTKHFYDDDRPLE